MPHHKKSTIMGLKLFVKDLSVILLLPCFTLHIAFWKGLSDYFSVPTICFNAFEECECMCEFITFKRAFFFQRHKFSSPPILTKHSRRNDKLFGVRTCEFSSKFPLDETHNSGKRAHCGLFKKILRCAFCLLFKSDDLVIFKSLNGYRVDNWDMNHYVGILITERLIN